MLCVSCGQDLPFIEMVFAAVRDGDTKRYRCWTCYDRLTRYVDADSRYIDPDELGDYPRVNYTTAPLHIPVSSSMIDDADDDIYECSGYDDVYEDEDDDYSL